MEITPKIKTAFSSQRAGAKRRNIPFNLTFEQWWEWWQATGHFAERGVGRGKYVMARYGDVGPYDLDNIFCCTQEENVSMAQAGKSKPMTAERKKQISEKMKGRPLSEEHKKNIGNAVRGKEKSLAHRENLRQANLGRKLPEETKLKISATMKERGIRPKIKM